ncbi:hypothetical protein LSAT2_024238 [Lamellibrachia satsuma]|nr:hypothetical protein LSAT2_024238 [Lamellibrachia satsuma]
MKSNMCAFAVLLLLLVITVSTTEGASTELCVCTEKCRWDDIKCQGDNWTFFSLRFSQPEVCSNAYKWCLKGCHERFKY